MFCIVAKVFGNIINLFSADNWRVLGRLSDIWLVFEWFCWFLGDLAGL